MPSSLITLDVSGRKYRTAKATLQTSPYFQSLLARWEDRSDKQDDGSLFVDADADIFQHILDFMRRPSKFPLFWTKEKGFDYALYNKLEAEADYFLLHDLRDWIRQNRYLDAVKVVVEAKTLSERDINGMNDWEGSAANVEVASFFGHYSGIKRWRCPFGVHDGYSRSCNYECEKVIRSHGPRFDNPEQRLTLVIKKTVFHENLCVNTKVM